MSLRFRRHYKLLVALVLVAAVLALGLGDQRIVAYTVQGSEYRQAVADVVDLITQHSSYLASPSE